MKYKLVISLEVDLDEEDVIKSSNEEVVFGVMEKEFAKKLFDQAKRDIAQHYGKLNREERELVK